MASGTLIGTGRRFDSCCIQGLGSLGAAQVSFASYLTIMECLKTEGGTDQCFATTIDQWWC